MKIGVRKPNVKSRIKARTTGKVKRSVKKAVNPLYGKKGMGLINDPKKAVYNKVYNKTSVSVDDLLTPSKSSNKKSTSKSPAKNSNQHEKSITQTTKKPVEKDYVIDGDVAIFGNKRMNTKQLKTYSLLMLLASILTIIAGFNTMPLGIILVLVGIVLFFVSRSYARARKELLKLTQ